MGMSALLCRLENTWSADPTIRRGLGFQFQKFCEKTILGLRSESHKLQYSRSGDKGRRIDSFPWKRLRLGRSLTSTWSTTRSEPSLGISAGSPSGRKEFSKSGYIIGLSTRIVPGRELTCIIQYVSNSVPYIPYRRPPNLMY